MRLYWHYGVAVSLPKALLHRRYSLHVARGQLKVTVILIFTSVLRAKLISL